MQYNLCKRISLVSNLRCTMYTLCSAWMPWWCVCYSPAQSWFHFSPAPKTGHIRSMDGLPLWFPNLFFSGKSSPHLNTDKLCLIWCVSALRTYLQSERQWDWGWIEWTGEYLAVGQKRLNNKNLAAVFVSLSFKIFLMRHVQLNIIHHHHHAHHDQHHCHHDQLGKCEL